MANTYTPEKQLCRPNTAAFVGPKVNYVWDQTQYLRDKRDKSCYHAVLARQNRTGTKNVRLSGQGRKEGRKKGRKKVGRREGRKKKTEKRKDTLRLNISRRTHYGAIKVRGYRTQIVGGTVGEAVGRHSV